MRVIVFLGLLFLSGIAGAISESQVDMLVEKAPKIQSKSELSKLVKKLTYNLKKDKEKAYVLLSWIVKNIDYDMYKMNQIEENLSSKHSHAEIPESDDIIRTRLGVCEDIASLYEKMLEMSDMKAVVITGCTNGKPDKKTGKCPDEVAGHAWNAVWIEDQWELVDPTWAMTGKYTAMDDVKKKRKYEKELKKREKKSAKNYELRSQRSVDKKWFMTNPKTMQEDHQPKEEKWLLLKIKDRKNKNL